jgi:hypothetical protein
MSATHAILDIRQGCIDRVEFAIACADQDRGLVESACNTDKHATTSNRELRDLDLQENSMMLSSRKPLTLRTDSPQAHSPDMTSKNSRCHAPALPGTGRKSRRAL